MECHLLLFLTFSLVSSTNEIIIPPNGSLYLNGQPIPSNGVVIWSDISKYGNPANGLYCAVNVSNVPVGVKYWSFPSGKTITYLADVNEFGIDNCHYLNACVSLYYEGKPPERGQFKCIIQWETQPTFTYAITPANIVNMTFSTPTGPTLVGAGDNIELSVTVTITPDNVQIPYRWQLNETYLSDDNTYYGTKDATLTILNVTENNTGQYRVSVADSASGITGSLMLNVVRAEIVHDQSTNASVGDSYRLTCSISGYDKLQQFSIAYQWFKNGILYKEDMTSATLNFNSLTFDDHGAYSCRYFFTPHEQARVVNGTSPLFVLDFNEVVYQLSLKNIHDSCSNWIKHDIYQKLEDINNVIIRSLQRWCSKEITKDNICSDYHGYTCQNDKDNHVVYNTHLVATPEATTTKLVECLDQWSYYSAKIKFRVNGIELDLDKKCSGVIDVVSECSESPALSLNNVANIKHWVVKKNKNHAILSEQESEFKCPASPGHDWEIGLGVGGFVVLLLVVLMIITLVILKKRYGGCICISSRRYYELVR